MYNPSEDRYVSIKVNHINKNLLFQDVDKDLAVLLLNKSDVQGVIGDIPKVRVVTTRQNKTHFIVKGFPNATMGKELDVIYPTWKQELTMSFQEESTHLSIKYDAFVLFDTGDLQNILIEISNGLTQN